jgi:Protein of unknown function (DUF3011)
VRNSFFMDLNKAFLAVVLAAGASLVGASAQAQTRLVLNLGDGLYFGENVLPLRQLLWQQHGIRSEGLRLRAVRLVGKTEHGRGTANLRVGPWRSQDQVVQGRPQHFYSSDPRTFDIVGFRNDAYGSEGAWQLELSGRFMVRRVVLMVDGLHGGGIGGGGTRLYRERLYCGAKLLTESYCSVSGRLVRYSLLDQLSKMPCIQGSSFNADSKGIWVKHGCRGNFEVVVERREPRHPGFPGAIDDEFGPGDDRF